MGNKETGVCKAFAYLMAYDKNLFNINYASKYFEDLSVRLEKDYRGIGRTDIELFFGDYQIIFEN